LKSNFNNKQNYISSQAYKNNPLISNNANKLKQKATKSIDLNKTPISGNSDGSITNFNNNNIIINNKYEAPEASKPITNLNMIFKFKTILNDEANSKNNKIVKIDAKKVTRNTSANKTKNTSNASLNDKNSNSKINQLNNNINNNSTNLNNVNNIYNSNVLKNSIINLMENKDLNNNNQSKNNNTINTNNSNFNNTIKKKIDSNINNNCINNNNQNKKVLNMNSTLKTGNSTSKNKIKDSKANDNAKLFDPLKYSISQLKDYLNLQSNNNADKKNSSKSKSKSKSKVGNMGNSKKYSTNL